MSDEHEGLAAWLHTRGGALLPGSAPGAHLDDERLAVLAEGRAPAARRGGPPGAARPAGRVAAAVVEAVPAAAVGKRRVWPWLVLPLAAAAAVAVFTLRPAPPPAGEWQVRGGEADVGAPEVAITAEDGAGRRILADGGRVTLGGRLAFRYGNAEGRARRLVVVAYDGSATHAWYPETLAEPGFP
ncbi:MAG: hypothetical protein R3F43_32970 [bacterium]